MESRSQEINGGIDCVHVKLWVVITGERKQGGAQHRPLWYTKTNWHRLRLAPINRCYLCSSREIIPYPTQ